MHYLGCYQFKTNMIVDEQGNRLGSSVVTEALYMIGECLRTINHVDPQFEKNRSSLVLMGQHLSFLDVPATLVLLKSLGIPEDDLLTVAILLPDLIAIDRQNYHPVILELSDITRNLFSRDNLIQNRAASVGNYVISIIFGRIGSKILHEHFIQTHGSVYTNKNFIGRAWMRLTDQKTHKLLNKRLIEEASDRLLEGKSVYMTPPGPNMIGEWKRGAGAIILQTLKKYFNCKSTSELIKYVKENKLDFLELPQIGFLHSGVHPAGAALNFFTAQNSGNLGLGLFKGPDFAEIIGLLIQIDFEKQNMCPSSSQNSGDDKTTDLQDSIFVAGEITAFLAKSFVRQEDEWLARYAEKVKLTFTNPQIKLLERMLNWTLRINPNLEDEPVEFQNLNHLLKNSGLTIEFNIESNKFKIVKIQEA